jgi:uncharacterized membrane protein (UPF0182 family)
LERRTRGQRIAAGVVAGLIAAWSVLRGIGAVVVDRWWLESVTEASVWGTVVGAKATLAVVSGIVTLLLLGSTVALVLRSRPATGQELPAPVAQYHQRFGPAHRWLLVGTVLVVTWMVVTAATGHWQSWLLFLHGPALGIPTPEIGRDLGYHLFRLPLLASASGWLQWLLLVCMVVAALGHLASGALQFPGGSRRTSRLASTHLAALGVLLAIVRVIDYILVARPSLATNRSGSFDGPGYVQLHVESPGMWVLTVVAALVAGALVYGILRGAWRPALLLVAAWALLTFLILGAIPAAVQSIVVKPAAAARELRYIAHNLDATKRAYRLDVVESSERELSDAMAQPPTSDQLTDVSRLPLFDADDLVSSLQVLQGTTATRISDVDVDRYDVDGTRRAVLVAARNASRPDLPERGWVQSHLVYTHGNGVVLVPADQVGPDGRPDVDALADMAPERSELYFGEGLEDWYAIVGTKRQEQGEEHFDAQTGIGLSTTWRRLAFALSVGETEPFLSAELTDDSQLLLRRGLRDRLKNLAPFLEFDANAHPAVLDDRIVWVVDGYTTAATYPYAQFATQAGLDAGSDLGRKQFNYLHGSVKATVDAYTGEVHLYRTEVGGADDPILDVWSDIFPGLIEPAADIPADVNEHFLYPPDLLTVQSSLLGRYHVETAEDLFDGAKQWSVSREPSSTIGNADSGPSDAVSIFWPADDEFADNWVSLRSYTPGAAGVPSSSRLGLAGFVVADNDSAERIQLVSVAPTTGRQVSSPQVAQSVIDAEPELARTFTFLNSKGSKIRFGPMTMVPLDDAVVWVRPIIVTGSSPASIEHLYDVVAVSNGLIGRGSTAGAAVADAARADAR